MKEKLVSKNPDAPLATILKAIQLDWNRLPPYRKRYFYKQANENKIQYDQDIELWEKELAELKLKKQMENQKAIEEDEILRLQ